MKVYTWFKSRNVDPTPRTARYELHKPVTSPLYSKPPKPHHLIRSLKISPVRRRKPLPQIHTHTHHSMIPQQYVYTPTLLPTFIHQRTLPYLKSQRTIFVDKKASIIPCHHSGRYVLALRFDDGCNGLGWDSKDDATRARRETLVS